MTIRNLSDEEIQHLIAGKVSIIAPGRIPVHDGVQLFEKEYTGKSETSADAAIQLAVQAFEADRRQGDHAHIRAIDVMGVDFTHVCIITAALRPAPMDFSQALLQLKKEHSVARTGWNGAGQFVYMENFERYTGPDPLQPCFVIRNAQGKFQPGWVPSMGDLLALDWEIV